MPQSAVRIVFTDLDGTLLNTKGQVSAGNLNSLARLGERGIVRVIATGRSPYSFRKVIGQQFPADYLIFSSGAGILDLHREELLFSANLEKEDVDIITQTLTEHETDFMVHHQVPDNHRFVFLGAGGGNEDFHRRIRIYSDFAKEYKGTADFPRPAAQIIAVLTGDSQRFARLTADLAGYQTTRTTSPLDHRSIWLEIQPSGIHKGSGAAWLCNHLNIAPACSVGIGNDYNDLDLLEFTAHSFLVRNSPAPLHRRHHLVGTNDEDGFRHGVQIALSRG